MLEGGWKVVPGTQYTVSLITGVENGVPVYELFYSIVLVKEDEAARTKAEHDRKQDEVAKWM